MADRRSLINDQEEAIRLAIEGHQAKMWTAIPCIVQSVNFTQMTLQAQPAIQGQISLDDGTTQFVNLPLVVDVPICFPSAGGFALTLPIHLGDEVLVLFASRCIDSWWQSGGIGLPAEMRMHDLSDGFAIPGPKSLPNVMPSISPTNAQLRNTAGTTYLEITPTGVINLVAPLGVHVTGNLTVSGEVFAGATLIPLSAHIHTGVTTGSGSTGVPVP